MKRSDLTGSVTRRKVLLGAGAVVVAAAVPAAVCAAPITESLAAIFVDGVRQGPWLPVVVKYIDNKLSPDRDMNFGLVGPGHVQIGLKSEPFDGAVCLSHVIGVFFGSATLSWVP